MGLIAAYFLVGLCILFLLYLFASHIQDAERGRAKDIIDEHWAEHPNQDQVEMCSDLMGKIRGTKPRYVVKRTPWRSE